MLNFYGKFSEECFKKTSKKQNINNAKVSLIFTILAILITIFIGIYDNGYFKYFIILTSLAIIVNILVLIVPPKSMVFKLPRKITIDDEKIIVAIDGLENWKPKIRKIEKIKKIIDEGDWYFITFKWDITDTIVIQKDWIQEGTIEEFEEFFKDKIVRKTTK